MGTTTLQPGQFTSLSISMMMHPGMDGPHRFRISLPVDSPTASAEVLSMMVTADFR